MVSRILQPRIECAVRKKNDDRVAKRYCFRASARILDIEGKPHGIFTAFDASVDVAKIIENACQIYIDSNGGVQSGLYCDDTELVLFKECPVEACGDISFVRINEEDEAK